MSRGLVEALARVMSSRDEATAQHALRVQRYALALAHEMFGADAELIEAVEFAALLHDVGKLAIPDRVLCKPGPLTRDEYAQVKHHAAIGADMLGSLDAGRELSLIVRHHHEHWDGSGYPDGLRGEAIPVGARLLAVVDCYDALTSERPYRRGLPHDRALAMMRQQRGTMFDPACLDAFLDIVPRLIAAAPRARRDAVPGYAFRLRTPRLV